MDAIKLYKILLTSCSTVENKSSKRMVISHAKRISVNLLTVTGPMATGIGESLNLMLNQAMASFIRQPLI